ncbi:MAG: cation-transporting P-type ATPase [Thermoanaerobaculia bacterium]
MPEDKAAFWRESLADLSARLGATPAGLSGAEAASRLARRGPNVLRAKGAAPSATS